MMELRGFLFSPMGKRQAQGFGENQSFGEGPAPAIPWTEPPQKATFVPLSATTVLVPTIAVESVNMQMPSVLLVTMELCTLTVA